MHPQLGLALLGLVTIAIMTHRGLGKKLFDGIIITHQGPGKKFCGIITSIIVTVEHNLEHNSPFWGQCQKA